MKDDKQYFYLVAIKAVGSETYVIPNRITLQVKDAIKHGRRLATKFKKEHDEQEAPEFTIKLYRQLISKNGVMEFVKVLEPFTDQELLKSRLFPSYHQRIETPEDRIFILDKKIKGVILPYKSDIKDYWITGVAFMDGTFDNEAYSSEETALKEYNFLKSKLNIK